MTSASGEGSSLDAAIFGVLLAVGILVLARRGSRVISVLKASWPVLAYFTYCLVSVVWSDYPDIAFKRWTKAIGDLAMVLIVVSDPKPVAALERVFSRTSFILLPTSLLLIKYYENLGRAFDPYGWMMVTGVTTDKNLLGVMTMVLSLGAAWRLLTLIRGTQAERARYLLVQGTILAMGITLLIMAHSATSGACFAVGAGLMLATNLPVIGRRPAAVHVLVFLMVLAAGITMLVGGDADVVHAMGRNTDFTGRTEIWKTVIPMAPNAVIGAGFESFWLGPRLAKVWNVFPVFRPNEAHDGYIEVYLNLGWLGVGLIALILLQGYWRAVAAFRRDSALGALLLAYVVCAAVYSITEAGFRMLDPIWIFLLLGAVAAGNISSLTTKRPARLAATPSRTASNEPRQAQICVKAGGMLEAF